MKRLALPIAWFVGIVAAALMGFSTDPYLQHVMRIPPPHPYPTETVAWVVMLITVHTALLAAILRPTSYDHSWIRSLLSLAVSLVFFSLGVLGAMHSPPHWMMYILWLLAVAVGLFVLFLWSLVGALRTRRRT